MGKSKAKSKAKNRVKEGKSMAAQDTNKQAETAPGSFKEAFSGQASGRTLAYPIADTLGAAMILDEFTHSIPEVEPLVFKIAKGYPLDLDLKALTSFVNKDQGEIGLLVHVKHDLCLLLTYADNVDTVCVYLFDRARYVHAMGTSKLHSPSVKAKDRISALVERLMPGLVAGWRWSDISREGSTGTKSAPGSGWRPVDLELLRAMLEKESDDDQGVDGRQAPDVSGGAAVHD